MTDTLDMTLADWMTRGGDARIVLDPQTGLNRYFSSPYPRDVLALASSTANDISADAYAHLSERFADGAEGLQDGAAYEAFLEELRAGLGGLEQDECPFDPPPPPALVRTAHYVRPALVVEVEFVEWTGDGSIRHSTFCGFRSDITPEEVRREAPVVAPPKSRT